MAGQGQGDVGDIWLTLFPILEHDPTEEAIIEPRRLIKPLVGMPEHGVICFFQDVIDHFCRRRATDPAQKSA
ncbi:MAG: hypothetical protein U0401_14560 [Anaerolineae bacterium]